MIPLLEGAMDKGGIRLITNQKSGGSGSEVVELLSALEEQGLSVQTIGNPALPPDEAARLALQEGARVLIVAGGDGTISSVAHVIAGTDAVLGVIPSGTLNHFAKDLKIPLEPAEAAKVIASGKVSQVDVGEVNGRVFINNSSLGLYPRFASLKEDHRRKGRSRIVAMFWALAAAVRRIPFLSVRFQSNGVEMVERKTPIVFVGNNHYTLTGAQAGTRETICDACLSVVIVHADSAFALIRLSFSAFFGRVHQKDELEVVAVHEAWIETRRRRARVSFDGEVEWMDMPLHYKVRPKALRVLVP